MTLGWSAHHRNGEGEMFNETMPFGRYKGQSLEDIPSSYLAWALRTCDLDPWLEQEIKDELESRRPRRPPPPPPPRQPPGSPPPPPPVLAGIIDQWYRRLALRYHPDRGGSTLAMQVVNEAVNELREMMGVK
jgi:hypothetical protein